MTTPTYLIQGSVNYDGERALPDSRTRVASFGPITFASTCLVIKLEEIFRLLNGLNVLNGEDRIAIGKKIIALRKNGVVPLRGVNEIIGTKIYKLIDNNNPVVPAPVVALMKFLKEAGAKAVLEDTLNLK